MKTLSLLLSLLALSAIGQTAYWHTNSAGEAVFYATGPTNGASLRAVFRVVEAESTPLSGGGEDGVEIDPTTIENMTVYYNATNLTTLNDGDNISTWFDAGAGGSHLTSGEGVDIPKKYTDASGQVVARFDGTSDYMWAATKGWASFAWYDKGTFIFRAKPSTDTRGALISWGTNDYVYVFAPYDGEIMFDWKTLELGEGRVATNTPSGWATNWHTIAVRRHPTTPASQSIRIDGITVVSNTVTGSGIALQYGSFRVGGPTGSGVINWGGDLRALVGYSEALTDEQVDGIGLFFENQP